MKRGKFEADNSAQPQETAVSGDLSAASTRKAKSSGTKNILLYLHDLVYLLCGFIIVFLLCFRVVVVSGTSMYNTLVHGDYLLLLSSTFYTDPQPGDIVVISKESFDNGEPIVKRVIATEGQWVDINFETGVVYVDGQALQEDYTYTATNTKEGIEFPLQVSDGCVFVLGDNRNSSKDSRHPDIGLIDKREILGKAIFLVFPGKNSGERQYYRIGAIS